MAPIRPPLRAAIEHERQLVIEKPGDGLAFVPTGYWPDREKPNPISQRYRDLPGLFKLFENFAAIGESDKRAVVHVNLQIPALLFVVVRRPVVSLTPRRLSQSAI